MSCGALASFLLFAIPQAASAALQCSPCSQPSFGPASSAFTTRFDGDSSSNGAASTFVAVGDFNNDGIPDLAVDGGLLLIYIGTGSGSYHPPISLPYSDPRAIAVGDFNGDGNLDLAIGSSGGIILLGDGKGGFSTSQKPVGFGAEYIAVGDFDGDGILDLATADYFGNELRLYHGTGDGNFSLMQMIPVGSGTNSFYDLVPRVADFNHDGIDDLAVASTGDGKIGILLGRLGGGLTVSYAPSTAALGGDLRIGDFDGDGIADILAEGSDRFGGPKSLTVFVGNGDGTFHDGGSFFAGYSILFETGDFNGDGKRDIAIIKSYDSDSQDYGLFVYPGIGDGTFGAPISTLTFGPQGRMFTVADVNLDGKLDLVVPTSSGETVQVLLGSGNGHFEESPRFSAGVQYLQGIAAADFNNDGIPDVVVTGFLNGQVGVLLGTGAGGFESPRIASVPVDGGVVTADFNNDGKMDVAVSDGFDDLFVLLGSGDGNLGSPIRTEKDHGQATLAVGDFDGDGKQDIVVALGKVVLFRGRGDGTFELPSTITTLVPSGIAVGDVNGDGLADIVLTVSAFSGSTLQVLLGHGDGTFSDPVVTTLDDDASAVALGDMNDDGKVDVVLVYPYLNSVGVLLGDGSGSFQSSLRAETNGYYRTLSLTDINGDGFLDVVITSQDNAAILPGKGDGHLGRGHLFGMPGTPMGAAVGSFDTGGQVDVVVGCQGTVYTPPDFIALLSNTSCHPRRMALTSEENGCIPPATAFPSQPILQILDDGDNVITCAGGSVSASILPGSGTSGAILGGSTSSPVANGMAAFIDLSIDRAGAGYQLEFHHPAASTTRTVPFSVGNSPAPPVAGNNGPICAGQTLQLTASMVVGATYTWKGPNGFIYKKQNPSISDVTTAASGDYSVTVDVAGCASAPATTTVVVHPLPSSALTRPAAVCPGSDGNVASVPDAGAGATYVWSVTNGTITTRADGSSIGFAAGRFGPITVSVTVTDANGCSSSSSAVVLINQACPMVFYTVVPCRLIDTRRAPGPNGGPSLQSETERTFILAGSCGIPADATAFSVNVAVVQPTAGPGFLTAYPGGTPRPQVATINYRAGQIRANNAIVNLGNAGDVTIYCAQGSGTVDVVVDVNGYFR